MAYSALPGRSAGHARAPMTCGSGLGSECLVVEVKYLAWAGDNLLRQVVYEGLREDNPAAEVRREVPRAK